ncbi:MAG: CehA/McbA family metallohydrolase [Gemmatimonadales bacterium]
MVLSLICTTPALAQRKPVLDQVRVPHPYYFREMYLPQATSGPTAPSWSPDGTELVYSMQGTLWRQRLGTAEARQLTDGPGYDYQPDWSPDGRRVVYASYDGAEVELRLLDLASGASRSLVRNGAVNVDPRWSPDGRRIAFVSTAHEGRFHVFVADVHAAAGPARPARLTEDRHGGLPRYYYHAYDQYISPAWSPDGRELLVVSNRGQTWGSGTIWRVPAEPGGVMREIRAEETTWRADPDWSRDGRRVVYSSYIGRQWNQLWLTTAAGETPLQLTYGEHDATMPRWSPDGRRIAYVSNAEGNTGLEVVHLPTGRREAIAVRRRSYLRATGRLTLAVTGAGGRAVPARVSVVGADGRSWAPDDAWRHADDGFARDERRYEAAYFHTRGLARLTVPADEELTIEVTRGPEYRVERRRVRVPGGRASLVAVRLVRIADLAARGWWSGDLHVHMNYGGHYRATPATLRRQAEAEDLHVIENLIVNKEGRVPDVAWFTGRPDPASTATALILHDEEYHTSLWGHLGLLGLTSHLLLPPYAAYPRTAAASLFPANATVLAEARAQGALGGYVHPGDVLADTTRPDEALYGLPVDAALGLVDYMEIVSFSEPLTSAWVWYRLLNAGFRIAAGAGTDAMANFASLRGPVGLNRVYAKLDGPLSRERFHAALKAGHTFATNGPLLEFTLGGREIGQEIALPEGGGRLRLHARLRSYVPVERFELVSRGRVAAEFAVGADSMAAVVDTAIDVAGSGWYTVRAWSRAARHPVLDSYYPFATTSPIYVTVGGAPIRSPADAAYFLKWTDRLDSLARAHADWNTPAERDEVLGQIARARAVFEAGSR